MNFIGKITVLVLPAALLGSVALFGGSARAAETDATTRTVYVYYGDLDVSTQSGSEVLFSRLKAAAKRACGGHPDGVGIPAAKAFDDCAEKAMDAAVTRVNAPKLSALSGKPAREVASSD